MTQTVKTALEESADILKDVSDAPSLDAERLLLHVLGQKESSWLFAHSEEVLSPTQQKKFEQLVAQRRTGKPLAYILGEVEFYGRTFLVNSDVLIPRPETEDLIDATLAYLDRVTRDGLPAYRSGRRAPFTIADIGTGSGIIAVTLLKELRIKNYELRVVATDISEKALEVAKQNAERHNVTDRIEFLQGDMLEPLKGRAVDLIVSNPPYIPTSELKPHFAPLEHGATRGKPDTIGLGFEPRIALDGGPDGQESIDKLKTAGIPMILEVTGGRIEILP